MILWDGFMSLLLCLLCLVPIASPKATIRTDGPTWGTKLGFPADKRAIILHADDIGMCHEANASAQRALLAGEYRSAAAMVPCPWFNDMA